MYHEIFTPGQRVLTIKDEWTLASTQWAGGYYWKYNSGTLSFCSVKATHLRVQYQHFSIHMILLFIITKVINTNTQKNDIHQHDIDVLNIGTTNTYPIIILL